MVTVEVTFRHAPTRTPSWRCVTFRNGQAIDGFRTIEISQVHSLPFAGMMLSDLGAEVIKVENPLAPEVMRQGGNIRAVIPAAFFNLNRGKRFLGVDASKPEGADLSQAFTAGSDAVLRN